MRVTAPLVTRGKGASGDYRRREVAASASIATPKTIAMPPHGLGAAPVAGELGARPVLGIGDGDGDWAVTMMRPCIAAYPWIMQ